MYVYVSDLKADGWCGGFQARREAWPPAPAKASTSPAALTPLASAAGLHPARASGLRMSCMSHCQGPRRECLFTIAHLWGLCPAGPAREQTWSPGGRRARVVSGGILGATPLARFLVSPLILCPRGLGRGTVVDVENWVLGQSLLPHPLWGTEAAPQKAALASARPQMAVQE